MGKADVDWKLRAVLIVGPRKSGTSLLQSLVDGAAGLVTLAGELKLKWLTDFDSTAASLRWPRYLENARSLVSAKRYPAGGMQPAERNDAGQSFKIHEVELPPESLDTTRYVERMSTPDDANQVTLRRSILQDLDATFECAPIDSPACWAAKEAGGRHECFIPQFKAMFPEAKIITIVRHPAGMLGALSRDRARKAQRFGFSGMIFGLREMRSILIYALSHHDLPDRRLVIYEKLVASPEKIIRKLAESLGLDKDSISPAPTLFGRPIVVSTSSRNEKEVFSATAEDCFLGIGWRQTLRIRALLLMDSTISWLVPGRRSAVAMYAEAVRLSEPPEPETTAV